MENTEEKGAETCLMAALLSVRTLTIFPSAFDWQLNYLQGYVSQTYTRCYQASWKQFSLAT